MNLQEYREKLYKFIDTSNLTDEEVECIYNRENQKQQHKLELQLKKALRSGREIYKKQRNKRA